MTKNGLPTYAIVELLIRLSHFNPLIGDYKGHTVHADGVVVKTTHGNINLAKELVLQQFKQPELITDAALISISLQFQPVR